MLCPQTMSANYVITNKHQQDEMPHNYCYFSPAKRINNRRRDKLSVCQTNSAIPSSQKNNQLFDTFHHPQRHLISPQQQARHSSGTNRRVSRSGNLSSSSSSSSSATAPAAAASNLSSLFRNMGEQTKLTTVVWRNESRRKDRLQDATTIAQRATTNQNIFGGVGGGCFRSSGPVFLVSVLLFALVGQLFLSQANGIKLQPEGKEKFYWSGEQFVITCQNNNNIKNVKIRWIGPNGNYITEDRSQRIHAESSGPHGHRLVVMNATVGQDDGQYKCTIGSTDDRQPRETTGFNLRLFQTTSFKETQRHLVLPTGSSGGTLNCHVEFDAQVGSGTVSWHRDGKPIEMFNDSTYQVVDYDPARQLSQLIIRPVQRDHAAKYTCRAVAVTSELSKISDFDIELTINFAPQFDQHKQVVWVESGQSVALRNSAANSGSISSGKSVFAGQSPGRHSNHRLQKFPHFQQHAASTSPDHQPGTTNDTAGGAAVVRVELRCTCQANPPASILWTSTQRSNFLLSKGEPAHVLEEPRVEVNGYNITSTLVIGYALDPNWPYRRDNYICSASNKLGDATKTFTIEQGDPPPAFVVDKSRVSYNPQTALIKFTLLSVATPTESNAQQSLTLSDIVPPVDSFRIRAEPPSAAPAASSTAGSHQGQAAGLQPVESRVSYTRRQLEPSVEWTIDQSLAGQQPLRLHNFTVNLSRLPAGQQRLFLEAHNAVGWSPNSTYLGEYYLVSAASALVHLNSLSVLLAHLLFSLYLRLF